MNLKVIKLTAEVNEKQVFYTFGVEENKREHIRNFVSLVKQELRVAATKEMCRNKESISTSALVECNEVQLPFNMEITNPDDAKIDIQSWEMGLEIAKRLAWEII